MGDRIAQLLGGGALKRSALNIRGGAGVFEQVLVGRNVRCAVEIGTYKGCSAAEMSQYCERVVTFDLLQGRLEQLGEKFDREEMWRQLGISNIELRLVRDDADKKQQINALDFDFAFVDGAHDATVRNDFELVRRCGCVLFHDADDNRLREKKASAPNHVFEFLSTLPKNEVQFIDIFALWTRKL